mmetsp:Transcript_50927/g.82653  ORF Transcript_50927/g.82653 Transcript_50927/m.82653 type:complete len:279 (-) Transcript_50927:185-1021(-)
MCPGPKKTHEQKDHREPKERKSPNLQAQLQPRPNAWEWHCLVCTFVNRPCFQSCEMCGFPRGSQPSEDDDPKGWSKGEASEPRPNRKADEVQTPSSSQKKGIAHTHTQQAEVRRTKAAGGCNTRRQNAPTSSQQPSAPAPPTAAAAHAGRELLAALKGSPTPPPPAKDELAGRRILAALKCNSESRPPPSEAKLLGPSERLLAVLKCGSGELGINLLGMQSFPIGTNLLVERENQKLLSEPTYYGWGQGVSMEEAPWESQRWPAADGGTRQRHRAGTR